MLQFLLYLNLIALHNIDLHIFLGLELLFFFLLGLHFTRTSNNVNQKYLKKVFEDGQIRVVVFVFCI